MAKGKMVYFSHPSLTEHAFFGCWLRINTFWRTQTPFLFHQRERKKVVNSAGDSPFSSIWKQPLIWKSSTVTSLTWQLIRFHLGYTWLSLLALIRTYINWRCSSPFLWAYFERCPLIAFLLMDSISFKDDFGCSRYFWRSAYLYFLVSINLSLSQ